MDFRLSISTEAIDAEKFTSQFQKVDLYHEDEFRRPATPLSRAKDLHGLEVFDLHLPRARPDEPKNDWENDWEKVEKFSDLFYNWADLEK
jgi:hypothetical protein